MNDACRARILRGIFDERLQEIFEDWVGSILMDPPPTGYEWQWADLLKENGLEQVVGLEEARERAGDRILVEDPNGESLEHWGLPDRSVHILVPREYANRVITAGRMD